MTNGFALLAHWSVRQKQNRVNSVRFSYVALYAPLLALHTCLRTLVHSLRALRCVK